MTLPAHAPWRMQGDVIAAFVRRSGARPALPDGIRSMPGPSFVLAVHYTSSPVGPYLELGFSDPARIGLRPRLCVALMAVSSVDARVGGIVNWGFPKELGTLSWDATDDAAGLKWKERAIDVSGEMVGSVRVPVAFPMLRWLQRR